MVNLNILIWKYLLHSQYKHNHLLNNTHKHNILTQIKKIIHHNIMDMDNNQPLNVGMEHIAIA